MSNNVDFKHSVDAFVKKTGGNLDKLLRRFSTETFAKIQERTPYKTGFARASWYVALNDENAQAVAGKNTLATAKATLSTAKFGDSVLIANNAKYIRRLEYGHSKQAPNGMVRVTLAQAGSILTRIANEIGGK